MQVVYIAPLKAIVRERMNDWKNCLVSRLGKKMVTSCILHFLFFSFVWWVVVRVSRATWVSQWFWFQVEMTGDYTPDLMALLSADIIISTPEKWDGISRNWHSRSYVTKVNWHNGHLSLEKKKSLIVPIFFLNSCTTEISLDVCWTLLFKTTGYS